MNQLIEWKRGKRVEQNIPFRCLAKQEHGVQCNQPLIDWRTKTKIPTRLLFRSFALAVRDINGLKWIFQLCQWCFTIAGSNVILKLTVRRVRHKFSLKIHNKSSHKLWHDVCTSYWFGGDSNQDIFTLKPGHYIRPINNQESTWIIFISLNQFFVSLAFAYLVVSSVFISVWCAKNVSTLIFSVTIHIQ